MGAKNKHLTWEDRLLLEKMLRKKYPKREIADLLGCSLATVYNEIKRGTYKHLNSDLTEELRYSPEKAYASYREKLKEKGAKPKLLLAPKLRKYIATMLTSQKYSPEAIIYEIKNNMLEFEVELSSPQTIYAGIRQGYFKGVTMKDLPRRGKQKQKKQKVEVLPARLREQKGTSITERPTYVETREEFGHWEMDCVVGKSINKKTALVLTERKTRYEVIERLKTHTMNEVVKALNRIEKRIGSSFYKIFKSITVDNGSEFKDFKGMEKALRRKGNRTKVYYCHPRSPNERGSNEVANTLVRRCKGLEKGANFDKTLTFAKCKDAQFWVNTYPRKLFNGKCSLELFEKEIENLNLTLQEEL